MLVENIAVTLFDKIGPCACSHLLELCGSAHEMLSLNVDELIGRGVGAQTAASIVFHRDMMLHQAAHIALHCERAGVRVEVKGRDGYPRLLAECADAPHVLYVRGDLDLNAGRWMSVVGTRKATPMGVDACRHFVRDLAMAYPEAVVVSGLAFGIDKAAHLAAMDYRIPTVAVMAGWVDEIVPPSHFWIARKIVESGGAVVSDMPVGTIIKPANFLSRNRIIAGLSCATMVVESSARGGSLVTADIASSYDREVFAIPGRSEDLNFAGTNALIRSSKALLYQDISDVAVALKWERSCKERARSPCSLPGYLLDVFNQIPDTEPTTIEQVAQNMDMSLPMVSSALIQLEMYGHIKSLQGRLYQKMKY